MNKAIVMCDLEWFSDEYFNPLVSSIGLVARLPSGEVKMQTFTLPLQEQLDKGAEFGKDCTGQFWAKEPLFGRELGKSLLCKEDIQLVLWRVIEFLKDCGKFDLYGNSTVVDNAKLIWLFETYTHKSGFEKLMPYYSHKCFATLKSLAKDLKIDLKSVEKSFNERILAGECPYFDTVEPHNPTYDAMKQLLQLEYINERLGV